MIPVEIDATNPVTARYENPWSWKLLGLTHLVYWRYAMCSILPSAMPW